MHTVWFHLYAILEQGNCGAGSQDSGCLWGKGCLQEAQGLFLWWQKPISSLRCCYTDVHVCQHSWNCTLKICHVCVCKIYIKKKRNLTQVWVIRIDQQRARLKMNLPPLHDISFRVCSVTWPVCPGPHRGVQDRTGGLDFQRAIVSFPFPGNEENYNRLPPCEICFVQIPYKYLIILLLLDSRLSWINTE